MGKNKLKKFAEMQTFGCVFQYPFAVLQEKGFDMKGSWRDSYFKNNGRLVLELGCGKGEYTVGLARTRPDTNYIGIDIKGARLWKGAKEAEAAGMKNVAFLRTGIELLGSFFAPGEVDEIWITFPDPQMQKQRRRLTSARFLDLYRTIASPGALIRLKTDSPFLYTYTRRLLKANDIIPEEDYSDLYAQASDAEAASIQTFYEHQWLSRGKTIKYLSFRLPPSGIELTDIDDKDIPRDDYHSYPRGVTQNMAEALAAHKNEINR